jgi:hypothetical protein
MYHKRLEIEQIKCFFGNIWLEKDKNSKHLLANGGRKSNNEICERKDFLEKFFFQLSSEF